MIVKFICYSLFVKSGEIMICGIRGHMSGNENLFVICYLLFIKAVSELMIPGTTGHMSENENLFVIYYLLKRSVN
jgi:hypothetical protein